MCDYGLVIWLYLYTSLSHNVKMAHDMRSSSSFTVCTGHGKICILSCDSKMYVRNKSLHTVATPSNRLLRFDSLQSFISRFSGMLHYAIELIVHSGSHFQLKIDIRCIDIRIVCVHKTATVLWAAMSWQKRH